MHAQQPKPAAQVAGRDNRCVEAVAIVFNG
jgi:hypothetical protein